MNVLVTGGAGYIGSHATRQLLHRGHRVVVVDNLSRGHRQAIDSQAEFVQADTRDERILTACLKDHQIEAILHFAASIEVAESVVEPLQYYQNNFASALSLLAAARAAGVQKFIFSSTAAVYGTPERTPIVESDPCRPINPYGRSKMMLEMALEDAREAYGIGYCVLRYFNVAGAHPDGTIGEAHQPETHLIPRLLRAALQDSAQAQIFGTDYPTPDGTCVRDYVHVVDLADAHVLATETLQPRQSKVFNLGSDVGFSVLEVLKTCEKVIGRSIPTELCGRRPGDPPILIASSQKIVSELAWKKNFPDLETMIAHAWQWHKQNPNGYPC